MTDFTITDTGYSWWTTPLVVNDGATYTWISTVTSSGTNQIHRVSWPDGTINTTSLTGPFSSDEHNSGAIAYNQNQSEIIVFYSRHNTDNHVRYQSINRSTLELGTQQQLDFGDGVSYAQVLVSGNTITLFVRVNQNGWWFRTSSNWGQTWSTATQLIDASASGQHYLVVRSDPTNSFIAHLLTIGHPNNSSFHDIGYARLDLSTGSLLETDELTEIGNLSGTNLPLLPTDFEQVYDAPGGTTTRVLDVGVVDGRPVAGYATWPQPNGAQTYYVRRWDGTVWNESPWSLSSGGFFGHSYLGGMSFGREGHDGRLITSRAVGSTWIIEDWQWNGSTFELTSEVRQSNNVELLRPHFAQGLGVGEFIYQDMISYSSYTSFSGDLTLVADVVEPPSSGPAVPIPVVIEEFVGEPTYRYIFGQAISGLITAEIPMYGVSMNTVLNAGYDFTGTFAADMTGFDNQILVNATDPGRTFVVVERDGFPVWDGNVVARTYQAQSKSFQVFARSLTAYPSRVMMDSSYYPSGLVTTNMEQTQLFLSLWETLQSAPESDLRVILPESLDTGVNLSLDIRPYDNKYFGDVMEDIANGADGFDWRIVTRKSGSDYNRVLQIGYPTIGMDNHNRLVFEYPGPIKNYWRTDGVTDAGTHIHGLGSGEGEDMLKSDVVHSDLIDFGYLRWDTDVELKDVTNQGLLDSLTIQVGSNLKVPKSIYVAELRGSSEPLFGTYLPGDACTLKFEDAAHPNGKRFETRIVGWRLTPPSSTSEERVSLYFEGGETGGF